MVHLMTVLLSTAFAGVTLYFMLQHCRGLRRLRNRMVGIWRRTRDQARTGVPSSTRGARGAGPLARPMVERAALERRVHEQRVAERRETLLRDLDEHASRMLALERALVRAGSGQREG